MRSLLYVAIGLAASIFMCISIWTASAFTTVSACLLLLFICYVLLSVRYGIYKSILRVLLGICIGIVSIILWKSFYWNTLYELDGVTTQARIEAINFSEKSTYGFEVSGKLIFKGKSYKTTVYMDSDMNIHPGDMLDGTFRFRTTVPYGIKDNSYYRSNGVLLLASSKKDLSVHPTDKVSARYFPAVLARRAKEIMEKIFPGDVLPFAKALMLGDTDDLDYATDSALKVSGVRHIVAVSGLHVGILYAIISLLVGHKRKLRFVIGTPIIVLFAACAGFSPSVTRACIVIVLLMLSEAIQMEYDPITELSFAVCFMLILNPFMIESVGFQLSVFSVVGILLFSDKIRHFLNLKFHCAQGKDRKNQFLRSVSFSIAVTAGAMSLTIPLSLYYFGTVCLVGIVSNLLILWLVSIIFSGVLLSTIFGFFSYGIGSFFACITAVPIRLVLLTAQQISRIPYASLYIQNSWTIAWVVLCYFMTAYFLIFRKGKCLIPAICIFSLIFTILAGAYGPRTDDFRVSVIDVGQGQSILLQSKGHTFIVDCGSTNQKTAADRTAQTLLSQSIFSVDGLIVTHMDADHSGGVEKLLTRIHVNTLYLPKLEGDWRDDAMADSFAGEVIRVDAPATVNIGNAKVTILTTPEVKTTNENSLGVLFESSEYAILITGDRNRSGEKTLIRTGLLKDVDVLVAGHHGSKSATSDELLQVVSPEIIMVSVGKDNSYGHPASEMLERAEAHGCTVQRTDEQGTLIYRR